MECVICKKEIIPSVVDNGAYGFNPWPVSNTCRCCDNCDDTVVIPTRLKNILEKRGKNAKL